MNNMLGQWKEKQVVAYKWNAGMELAEFKWSGHMQGMRKDANQGGLGACYPRKRFDFTPPEVVHFEHFC